MAVAEPRGAAPRPLLARLWAAPLLCCGFRPFFLGAALWAVSFAVFGFLVGEAHERILGKAYGTVLFGGLIALFMIAWLVRRWKAGRNACQNSDPEE